MSKRSEGAGSATHGGYGQAARSATVGLVLAMVAAACSDTAVPTAVAPTAAVTAQQDVLAGDTARGQRLGITHAPGRSSRGFDALPTTSTPGLMTLHGSSWMDHTTTYAIFLGTKWNTDPTFTGDKISSVQSFLGGYGGSVYANTVTEYGPTNASTFAGAFVDNSAAPAGDPGPAWVGAYVCSFLGSHGIAPSVYGFYAVYSTAQYPNGFLGYHSSSNCGGVTIKFALIFSMDNSGFVTDPYHYHSDNAAALVNVTAHELTEAITDAVLGNGWFSGNTAGEVADKCNFSFGPSPYITLTNGSVFKLQGQWSNGAYQTGTGFVNGNNPGEYGCVNSRATPAARPTITGPSQVSPYFFCYWHGSASGGTPPYMYSWDGSPWSAGGTTYGTQRSSSFTLQLRVKDADGRITSTSQFVYVYPYGPSCG